MKKTRKYSQKLFLVYACIYLAALLIIFGAALSVFYRQQYTKALDNQLQLVSEISEQLDVSLQNMDRIANGLLFNETFIDLMKDPDMAANYTNTNRQILNDFIALDAPLFPTYRIIAFNDTQYFNLSKSGENQSFIRTAIAAWPYREQLDSLDGRKLIIPTHQDSFSPEKRPVYSVVRSITDSENTYGVIEIQNEYSELEKLCDLSEQLGEIAVFSPDGDIIYPLEGKTSEQNDFYKDLFASISGSTALSSSSEVSHKIWRTQQTGWLCSTYSGWTTVIYCPVTQMVPNTLSWLTLILLLFALMAFSFLSALRIVTDRMTAPLIRLNNAIKDVTLDNLNIELPQQYGIEEIEEINRSFLMMFDHLKKAIAVNIQARANEERANYLALQSQMNPHTIYNTIGMIESISYMNGDREVSNLCICFSHMLRYISDYSHRQYTVRDELQHLENYAVLIQTRYGERLKILTDAAPSLLDQLIPKFTLQPLAENSVKHGFSNTCSHLTVKVEIQENDKEWYIQVSDNGKGIDPDRLEDIQRELSHCDESLSSNHDVLNKKIGSLTLSNIYIRFRIMFGSRLIFTAANNPGSSGCFVRISIQKEEDIKP